MTAAKPLPAQEAPANDATPPARPVTEDEMPVVRALARLLASSLRRGVLATREKV